MRTLVAFTLLALSSQALAASAHGGDGVPKVVLYQAINVVILFAILFYFLKDTVKNFFINKKSEYMQAAEKAQSIKRQAEAEYKDIEIRLNKLSTTKEESIARARVEAAEYKNSLIAEAQNISKRIKEEAATVAKLELEKAKNQIRTQILNESMNLAKTELDKSVSADDQKKLQGEFINNMQAVQP